MVERDESEDRTLPYLSTEDIQAACLRFRQAWRANEIHRLEDFLETVPFQPCDALLQALVVSEMDLRRAAGQSVDLNEYRKRFPNHVNEVESAHRRTQRREADSTTRPSKEELESEK